MDAFDWQAFFLANVLPPSLESVQSSSDTDNTGNMSAIKLISRAGSSSNFLNGSTNGSQSPVDFLSSTPTSITRVLTYTSPLIHLFSQFIALVNWETGNPSESCLLVAAWWTICLFPSELIVFGTHLILITWIGWRWVEKGKRERLGKPSSSTGALSQLDLNNTILEIEKISEKLVNFNAKIKDIDSHLDWSNPNQTQIVILGLLYSYPAWIILNYFVSLTWIFLTTGTIALVWHSPWFRVLRYAMMQSVLFRGIVRFIIGFIWGGRLQHEGRGFSVAALVRKAKEQQKKIAAKRQATNDSKTSTDLSFRFVLYENQRWWLGLDWTTNLFPNERPAWSDEYNEPAQNKNSFLLPPPTTSETLSPDESNVIVRKTDEWRWADADWWIDLDGDVDKDGWEYADNRWKGFSSKGGLRRFTRRRKWIRSAKLVETIEKIQKPSTPMTNIGQENNSSPSAESSKPLPTISKSPDGLKANEDSTNTNGDHVNSENVDSTNDSNS